MATGMGSGREKNKSFDKTAPGTNASQNSINFGERRRRQSSADLDIVPKLAGGDGLQVAGVGGRDADAILPQEALGTVQALRGQLVVSERPQQLADQDVCLGWGFPGPHVGGNDSYPVFPPAGRYASRSSASSMLAEIAVL